jgi:hypothetical protein
MRSTFAWREQPTPVVIFLRRNAMGYDLMLWRQRPDSRRSRGFIYRVLAEGLPCDGVEPIDCVAVGRDLDGASPGWQTGDAGFAVGLSATSMQVTLRGDERGDRALEIVRGLASRHGLELFDPQDEPISEKDERAAAGYLEAQRDSATAEQAGVWMRAAQSGDAGAMNELGNAYSWGDGVREDQSVAAHWYARAAAAGHAGAMANLAECYRSGEGVAPDPRAAIHWFEQAGARDHIEALVRLAEFYRTGDGVPKDPATARRILERASEKDGQVSAFMLAEMHESGEGGERDLERAKELYRVALSNRHPEARIRLRRLGVEPP